MNGEISSTASAWPELGVPTIPRFDFDDAPALFQACAQHGVELLVLKRLSAPYLPGRRSTSWRKVKCSEWAEHRERRAPSH